MLATGDSVLYYADGTKEYPNDAKWWRASGLAEKSLFVLGNHDTVLPDPMRKAIWKALLTGISKERSGLSILIMLII